MFSFWHYFNVMLLKWSFVKFPVKWKKFPEMQQNHRLRRDALSSHEMAFWPFPLFNCFAMMTTTTATTTTTTMTLTWSFRLFKASSIFCHHAIMQILAQYVSIVLDNTIKSIFHAKNDSWRIEPTTFWVQGGFANHKPIITALQE